MLIQTRHYAILILLLVITSGFKIQSLSGSSSGLTHFLNPFRKHSTSGSQSETTKTNNHTPSNFLSISVIKYIIGFSPIKHYLNLVSLATETYIQKRYRIKNINSLQGSVLHVSVVVSFLRTEGGQNPSSPFAGFVITGYFTITPPSQVCEHSPYRNSYSQFSVRDQTNRV